MRFILSLLFFGFSFSNAEAALFGIGASMQDELYKMETVAKMQEEFESSEGIVKFILDYQNKKKENFARQKNDRAENAKEASRISALIMTMQKRIKTLSAAEKIFSGKREKLDTLENEIADKEMSRNNLSLANKASTIAGYLARGAKALSNMTMLTKRIAGYGEELNQNVGEEIATDLQTAEADIEALYKKHVVLLDKVKTLEQGPLAELRTLRVDLEVLTAELGALKDAIRSFYNKFETILKTKYVKPLSNEAQRISESLNELIAEGVCPQIKDVSDLTSARLLACKTAAWKIIKSKSSKKLGKLEKCKTLTVESGSVKIEFCRRAYIKEYK